MGGIKKMNEFYLKNANLVDVQNAVIMPNAVLHVAGW